MLGSPGDFGEQSDPALVWRRVAGYLGPDDADLIRVATYTFRSLVADQWRAGNVLLAGDAAHQMPPFLGQGMCSGIRDARNLAFKLDLLRDAADPSILDSYQSEREPHVRTVTETGVLLSPRHTLRDPAAAAERDRAMRQARGSGTAPVKLLLPGLGAGLLSTGMRWAPGSCPRTASSRLTAVKGCSTTSWAVGSACWQPRRRQRCLGRGYRRDIPAVVRGTGRRGGHRPP